jgi:hypothetical protein
MNMLTQKEGTDILGMLICLPEFVTVSGFVLQAGGVSSECKLSIGSISRGMNWI